MFIDRDNGTLGNVLYLAALTAICLFLFLFLAAKAHAVETPDLTQSGQKDANGTAAAPSFPMLPTLFSETVPLSSGFDFPVGGLNHEGFEMNNCFGCDYLHYIGHTGEDYDNMREGDPVYSASEGLVVFRGRGPGAWGNVLIVKHNVRGQAIYTQYAHLRDMHVWPGQHVGRRQQIATVGTTGTSAPHLHFEIKDQPQIGHGYAGYNFPGLTIYIWGMNYWAPSWYINNHRYLDSPFGPVETALVPGGFKVTGWAVDPNTTGPIDVHVYLDGAAVAAARADRDRPDVAATLPAFGSAHGYEVKLQAPPGPHTVCVYGINTGPGANTQLGCLTVNLTGNPMGSLDSLSLDGGGQVQADGWAIDPDDALPIDVEFSVNGQAAGKAAATQARTDVEGFYPEYGASHGYSVELPKFPGDNEVCAYGVNRGAGSNTLIGCRTVRVPLEAYPLTPPLEGRSYYWPFYDSAGGRAWLIMASPASGAPLLPDVNIAGRRVNAVLFGSPSVSPGQSLVIGYRGLAAGPVVATSLTGEKAIVSQRTLWAGSSFEEVPATEAEKLSDHFFWSWYDQSSPGYLNWVMIANPGSESLYYEVTIAGENPGAGSTGIIAPGQSAAPAFPGRIGGPVQVRTFTDATRTAPAQAMASQRVLTGNGKAFNEAPGIPARELSDHYLWTWYDSQGSQGRNWIMLANPGSESLYYEVTIAGENPGPGSTGTIAPGQSVTPVFNGVTGGPVEVRAYADTSRTIPKELIATQRVLWGPSFGEVAGFPYDSLASDFHWTWYDYASSGASNWVMIANPGVQSVYYEVIIAGEQKGSGTIEPGKSAWPAFPGVMAGPVEVRAFIDASRTVPASVIASQRVLWNGHFNEVGGVVLGGGVSVE